MDLPTEFYNLLASANLVEKRAMLIELCDNIKEQEALESRDISKLKDYVEYIPTFVKDSDLIDGIQRELEDLKLDAANTKKVKTFWLNSTNHPYKYTGRINEAHLISNYHNINKLMNIINASEHTNNKLNSCLITCYGSSKKSLSLHSDNEPEICQQTPLCNVTFGCTRKIEFVPKFGGHVDSICSFDLEHCSLNVMKPGCNQVLKHRVPKAVHVTKENNVRYSLSFRRFIPPTPTSISHSPVKNSIKYFEKLGDEDGTKVQEEVEEDDDEEEDNDSLKLLDDNIPVVSKQIEAVLVAGDSHVRGLDCERLGKNRITVLNISKGGARICDTEKSISDFSKLNDKYSIVKVFVSVGTNDIRYCRRGVLHLTKPLKSLAERIKLCFPNARIWFQSLLPLPVVDPYVKSNVINFNQLLLETCTQYKIFLLDIFDEYLGPDYHRNIYLFEKDINNIHLNSVGLGKLAKRYINLIHRRHFNPRIYNIL